MLQFGRRQLYSIWAAVPRLAASHGDPCGHFSTRTEPRDKHERFLRFLESKITMRGGPLSVSEFMQDALTSPHGGYYMDRDVFGRSGDFVTSPEISQMFGEMVGAWVVYTWMQMRQPPKLNLVELGPGRGTLMADVLRSTAKFKAFASAVDVHLVEVSPALKGLQWNKLGCRPSSSNSSVSSSTTTSSMSNSTSSIDSTSSTSCGHATASGIILPPSAQIPRSSNEQGGLQGSKGGSADRPSQEAVEGHDPQSAPSYAQIQGELPAQGLSRFNDTQVTWHVSLSTVPQEWPAIYIAHEFFDALPVHQFVKDDRRGWVEKMVDTAEVHSGASTSGEGQQPEAAQQQQQQHHEQQERQLQGEGDPPPALRFVLSPGSTPASALLVPIRTKGMDPAQANECKELEVSAHGMATAEALAVRVGRHGGAALIIDYGRDAPYGDSLMAIRDHKGVELLDQPGSADLSTWVDFGALRQGAQESGAPVCVHGPVSQASFLMQLGIQARLEKLLQAATPAQAEQLVAGYKRLVGGSTGAMDSDGQQSGSSKGCSSSGINSGTNRNDSSSSSRSEENEEGGLGSRKTGAAGQDGGMGQSYQVMAFVSKSLGGPVAGFEGGKVVEVEDSDKVLTSIRRL